MTDADRRNPEAPSAPAPTLPKRIWINDRGERVMFPSPFDTAFVRADLYEEAMGALRRAKDVEHWHPNPCEHCEAIDRVLLEHERGEG